MALQLGDVAPDFEADTTEGRIKFHDWIGDSWAVLFSHPKDFTPVCTTELGYMASIEPEFAKRGVKIIGLSVDPLDKHEEWAKRHRGRPRARAPNYPIISDADFEVAKALRDAAGRRLRRRRGPHAGRQPDRAQRLRHRPRQEDQTHPRLPDDDRAQLRRGPARDRLAAAHRQAQSRDPGPVAAGRRRDHRRLGLQRPGEGDLPGRLGGAAPLHPHRSAAGWKARTSPRRSSRSPRIRAVAPQISWPSTS